MPEGVVFPPRIGDQVSDASHVVGTDGLSTDALSPPLWVDGVIGAYARPRRELTDR